MIEITRKLYNKAVNRLLLSIIFEHYRTARVWRWIKWRLYDLLWHLDPGLREE